MIKTQDMLTHLPLDRPTSVPEYWIICFSTAFILLSSCNSDTDNGKKERKYVK
jgi:hypothetical protein